MKHEQWLREFYHVLPLLVDDYELGLPNKFGIRIIQERGIRFLTHPYFMTFRMFLKCDISKSRQRKLRQKAHGMGFPRDEWLLFFQDLGEVDARWRRLLNARASQKKMAVRMAWEVLIHLFWWFSILMLVHQGATVLVIIYIVH